LSAFPDIGQGAGLATTAGARPLLPVIVTGVMAHEDAGVNFTGTDWSWMESWVFIGIVAAVFIVFWFLDRPGNKLMQPKGRPPEAEPPYMLLVALAGALLFAGSLADGGETSWPGLVAGAIAGFVGYLAFGRLFMRTNQRLASAGDAGIVLGLGRDVATIAITVLILLVDVVGYAALVAALVLLITSRGREDQKYEGLRILR
jgi:hypothetical protein